MNSMTGFGFAAGGAKDFAAEISIKSVNSRFLDKKFYTPAFYALLEPEFNKLISQKCRRGYFVARIERFPSKPPPEVSFSWDKRQALKWKKLYSSLSKEMGSKNDFTASDLINREGVVKLVEKPLPLSLQERKKIKNLFAQALNSCLQERKREGQALKRDILLQLKKLQSLFSKINILNKKQKDIFIKKKKRQINGGQKPPKEPAFEVEKFDVHEELIRCKEHVKHFKKISSSAAASGRKMDFYIQEILREVNTIGAKSQLADLTLKAVEGKFILEKIKEQIQNIE